MKKLLLLVFLLVAIKSNAQKGIKFEHVSWKEIVAKAKKEKKMIFMDAYTTWCGPCKMMTNTVFPDTSVGKIFNANFINVKMDMEAGEGPMIGSKYPVRGYPSLFFINPNDESIVNSVLGYRSVNDLIKIAETTLATNKIK